MSEKKLIQFVYKGSRSSGYCYHPAIDGLADAPGVWETALKRFRGILDSFVDVAELYTDQQTLSEAVGGPRWKKEALKLLEATEKDGKNPYQLEALAEVLFDVENKTEQREFPTHQEIRKIAEELRFVDFGLISPDAPRMQKKDITFRGWGS